MVTYKVKNKIQFSKISQTHFEGKIEDSVGRFFEKRVLDREARIKIFAEAEEALQNPHDDKTIVGLWSGEFWGKLEISACRVYEYTKDAELLDFIKTSAYKVLSYAREDGYINSYKNSANVFAPDVKEAQKIMGWPCDWNWNIWCRKYTLWGLIECGILTQDAALIKGAHRLAIQLIHELKEKGIRLGDTGTANFSGVPSGSIMKPMLLLYEETGDQEVLDFCIDIAEDWDREDGKRPNLIRNALSGKPVHEWYPDSHLWAKAYETMSCLDGLLELYRITGTKKYLQAVEAMYELLNTYESNVMGSVGFNDIFAHAAVVENAISEPCDVIHWMRMCSELFTLTGNAKYMDAVEKAFYNAYLAGVSADGTWGARGVRASGKHFNAIGQSGCVLNHCCVDNMPRGYLNMTSCAVMQGEDGLYITQYCPFHSTQNDGRVSIICSDGYLEKGHVTLHISSKERTKLSLRVPKCSGKDAYMKLDNVIIKIHEKCGEFVSCWVEAGTSEIVLDFQFKAMLHQPQQMLTDFSEQDFRIVRWKNEDMKTADSMMKYKCAYITYGPLLLARSKKVGATEQDMFEFESIYGQGYNVKVSGSNNIINSVICAFEVKLEKSNKVISMQMCDYASASNILSDSDAKYFNVFL